MSFNVVLSCRIEAFASSWRRPFSFRNSSLLAIPAVRRLITEGQAIAAQRRMKVLGFWDKDDLVF
jgi:hypothetical protein